jgi:putative flippase GtrA
MGRTKTKHPRFIQFIEYAISGGAYFWVGYLVFYITYSHLHWTLWWAKLGANIIGWIVNYLLQRYWVFRNPALRHHTTQVTRRYIIITLVDFGLDYLIVAGLKNIGITPYIGQFVSASFFTVWNYLWYRFWVFPEKMTKRKIHIRPIAHIPHGQGAYHKVK